MKKLMMALAFVGLGTVAANAQCDEFATPTTNKYSVATNSFWSNWFVQAGVDMNVSSVYGYGSLLKKDWHDGRTYGLDLAVGKWFTPGIGTRLKLNWENGAFHHAFRNADHVWETPNGCKGGFAPVLGLGFESAWKVSKRVGVYLDVTYAFTGQDYMPYYDKENAAFQADNLASVDLGVTFNLGKTGWSKAVSLEDYEALSAEACSKLAALRSQLKSEQDENARLRAELAKWANHKCPVASNVASAATSVFLNINSSKVNSKKDLINLEAVATAAKNTGATVVVTGAADSKTGSSAYNQKLSEARAQAVADELVNLGVDRAKIEVKGLGGVNDVAPFNLNRRAIITLK